MILEGFVDEGIEHASDVLNGLPPDQRTVIVRQMAGRVCGVLPEAARQLRAAQSLMTAAGALR